MTTLSIGRATSCDIVVIDPTVSRRHAELLQISSDHFRFLDRGSTSGSYWMVEGAWQPLTEAEVRGSDRLRLGDFETTVGELLGRMAQPAEPVVATTVIERDPETGRIVMRTR